MIRSLLKLRAATSGVLLLTLSWFPCASSFAATHLAPGELAGGFQATATPPGTPAPDGSSSADLRIVIVAGDNAANVIDHQAVKPVVEVRDKNNAPVIGAMVTFTSPSDGPGVIFSNGLREATAMTDDTGRATISTGTAVNAGAFKYEIAATFRDQKATASISQTNFLTAGEAANSGASQGTPASAKRHPNKMLWFIVGGVAVAAGVGAAAFHGGSGGSPASTPTVVIGAGSGATVGAPH